MNHSKAMFFIGFAAFTLVLLLDSACAWGLFDPPKHPELRPLILLYCIGLMVIGIGTDYFDRNR